MIYLSILVLLVAILLTGLIRHYALSRKILDIPNHRSSHNTPTARGGGLSIVTAFFFATLYLLLNNTITPSCFFAVSSALPVAFIGFCDDHADVPARWRFLTHLLAACCALYFLNGLPLILLNLDWMGYILAAFLLVWLLNLFNFMDGTDGIAASEAIFVSLSLAGYLYFIDTGLFNIAVMLASAAFGFLLWNWPKAKIFMGDVGSGFLGLLLGILILLAAQQAPVLLYCGLILFGVFVVDATYTLAVRFYDGQKWYQAHCSHTYQRAAKLHGHLAVLLASWAINLFWLLPLSTLVFFHPNHALSGLLLAYMPLIYLANVFKAGQPEKTN